MGQLLDGRNRRRACQELGIPLKVEQFVGTDQAALTYVLSVNQHRRELSKSQRAAVAVQLLPFISADVQAKRSARITATQRRKRTGEIMSRVAGSPPGASSEPALTRSVAADRMERLARTRRLSVHRRERRERRESFPNHEGHEADRVWLVADTLSGSAVGALTAGGEVLPQVPHVFTETIPGGNTHGGSEPGGPTSAES